MNPLVNLILNRVFCKHSEFFNLMRPTVSIICFVLVSLQISHGQLTRVANSTLNLPADLPSGTYTTQDAFPGLSFLDPVAIVSPPGETDRLFIVEQTGRIAIIPDLTVPSKSIFLDIQSRVRSSGNEEGLLGLAFHPNYNAAGEPGYGHFFVYYLRTDNGTRYWRLSRFSVSSGNPNLADSNSEVPLITQQDQASNHNGGDLHFGDDGYLYLSVGDEGGANDTYDNGQHIDKDFFAAIFRIDVDSKLENLLPNSHAAVHAGSYRIPIDNPFIGATTFNGSAVSPNSIRTEIWAIGMRNPFRMSFDRPTGRLFVADVGQGAREEIDILSSTVFATNGGIPNYGWSYREGFDAFNNGPGGSTPPAAFQAIDPIHHYERSLGRSVTGGLVYRGAKYPELSGDYLFADYVSGRIWAMDKPGVAGQSVTQIATDSQIAGFGINPLSGEILLADDNSNRSQDDTIRKIVRTEQTGTQPPALLSQTGAFSNLSSLTPNPGIVPYDVNVPFWSDRSGKSRWFSIPDVNDDMTWAENDSWTFPEGQVWIKHFDLDLDPDNPGTNIRRVETRFLVKTTDDVYGITYKWNAAQTDADLVAENGTTEDFMVTQGGSQITQTWEFPSRADCRTCHNETAGFSLSFSTRQLNSDFTHGASTENQITALENAGYFDNTPPAPATLPEFFAADDDSATLESRARSYLAVNCAQCHQPGGVALGSWDARPEISLEASKILDGALVNNNGDPFNRVAVPGSVTHSMLVQRIDAVGSGSGLTPMPPISTGVKNQEALDLLAEWIESEKKVLFIRGGDRSGGFLEGTNDTERTEHLADINNTTTGSGNHGWGELAATLRGEGYLVEQITEGSETSSGPADGIHLDLENLNLAQYAAIVFGSNNAVYDTAAIDAIDDWVRNGGSALFISDANFGGDWADAPNSDQQFLDRFGLVMNQDLGTYAITRANGDFLSPNHSIFEGVDEFHGEGVSPVSLGSLPGDVTATVLAGAEGSVRRNLAPFGNQNQGSGTSANANDGALLTAYVGSGRVAGHFDRNTFFNQGGVGSDITRFDNRQYAINLFNWLCRDSLPAPPTGLSGTIRTIGTHVEISWTDNPDADSYRVYRNTIDVFSSASLLSSPAANAYADTTAEPNIDYFYWVVAVNEFGNSVPSASAMGARLVEPPQPDLLIGKTSSRLSGDGIYYTTSGQTVRAQKSRRLSIKAYSALQNDGGLIERIRLTGTRKNRFFKIDYRRIAPTGGNITGAVSSARYHSAEMIADDQESYRITVRPTSKLKRTSRRKKQIIRLRGLSTIDSLRRDQVRFDVISRR